MDNSGRRRISAEEIRRRKIRRRKREMYKRLALLATAACITLILVVVAISSFVKSILDSNERDDTDAGIGHNNMGNIHVNVGAHESDEKDNVDEEFPTEPTTEPQKPVYGDDMYNDGEFVVCIDPGHGGNDVGCIGVDKSYEKNDTLMLAKYITQELQARGIRVVNTRTTDVWVDLGDRPAFANEQNADLLLSVHRNTYEDDSSVKGFEAWVNSVDSDNSYELAQMIMDGLERVGISKNRGAKKGSQASSKEDYKVNSGSLMPSVLLEMGFMSSPTDNRLYRDNAKAYAKSIADAIVNWSQGKAY